MSSSKVFVGGLDPHTSEDEVWSYFGQFGKVEDVRLPTDRETQQRKPFGFVTFENADDAYECMKEETQNIGGKDCSVKKAAPQGERRGGGGGGGRYGGGGGGYGGGGGGYGGGGGGRSYGGGGGGGGGRSYGGGGRGGGGGGSCYKCGEAGHFARECPDGGSRGGGGGGGGECYKCRRPGHFARECPDGDGSDRRDDRRSRPY